MDDCRNYRPGPRSRVPRGRRPIAPMRKDPKPLQDMQISVACRLAFRTSPRFVLRHSATNGACSRAEHNSNAAWDRRRLLYSRQPITIRRLQGNGARTNGLSALVCLWKPTTLSKDAERGSHVEKKHFQTLVQLRLRLRLVPVGPRRDVLQLRLEKIVQELLLRVLHLREDLARGGRADAIHGGRVDGPLPVAPHEIGDPVPAAGHCRPCGLSV